MLSEELGLQKLLEGREGRFCPKRRTRERIVKLRAIEPGVTINTTLHKKYNKMK